MTDEQLRESLERLGIDGDRVRAVMLLPLVQIAWVDGGVAPEERERVAESAASLRLEPGTWEELVRGWLTEPPSQQDFLRAQQVIAELAHRGGGAVDPQNVEEVLALSARVAEAAGGLFGRWFTVSEDERKVLSDLARMLRGGPGAS